jgi:hypothetical protein
MLRQHVFKADKVSVFHLPGEVVLAKFGNYLEAGVECRPKVRPVILLRASDCQHMFAGLTTKPRYKTTMEPRPMLPRCTSAGLSKFPSYLWSPRPAFISRLDIHKHLGWVDHQLVEFLAKYVTIDGFTLAMLYQAASDRGLSSRPRKPR